MVVSRNFLDVVSGGQRTAATSPAVTARLFFLLKRLILYIKHY
jgi:hypothetical protein